MKKNSNVDYINIDESALEEMPNGFVSLMANLTRTGIFTYQQVDPDGTVRILRQLRLPEEVFSEATLATLTGLPFTNNHPTDLITPANANDYIVGMTSDRPKKVLAPVQEGMEDSAEEFIQQQITVFDSQTISEIRNKKKTQISLGYKCELEFTSGTYKGQQYDAIQRNIRNNHVSLVKRARGGSNCRVLLDGIEQVVNLDGETFEDEIKTKEQELKVFILDGVEYKVEDNVYAVLTAMKAKQDALEVSVSSKQKDLDTVTAQCDDLKSKIKIQNDHDDKKAMREMVKARVSLETRAGQVLGEKVQLDSLSDEEIKAEVIKKLRPEVNLDGKSKDYIDARFEIALEDFKPGDKQTLGKQIVADNKDSEDVFLLVEKARKKAWEDSKKAYVGGK